jgi:threonine/homoserine/homoserine lactone efflux protein
LEAILAISGILGALLIGVVSPGPSFVLVARTAIAVSRRDGLAAAVGMGLGGVIFGTLALVGLTAVLAQIEWLYFGLKLLGGLYLLYLAINIWRGASAPIVVPKTAAGAAASPGKSFVLGLGTQISNPKTAIVYASVFAALLPPALPGWIYVVLPLLIFAVETGWYAVVALAFSADRPRAAYLRSKLWLDRLAGAVMGLLGVRLIAETARGA